MTDKKHPSDSERSRDSVVPLSSRSAKLAQWLATQDAGQEELIEDIAADLAGQSYPLDSKRTAEEIMRRIFPELYAALVAAGEVDE